MPFTQAIGKTVEVLRNSIGYSAAALGVATLLVSAPSPVSTQMAEAGESDGVLTIYIVRHGETDWNREGRIQGDTDNPLNSTGRAQAMEIASQLSHLPIDRIYPSALQRAIDTAEAFSVRAPITPLALLNERSRGIYEGKVAAEVNEEFRPRFADLDDDMDGGESLASIANRVALATREIVANHPTGAVMIVGHSGVNPLVIGELIGLPPEQAIDEIRQGNDEVYKLELHRDSGSVRIWKFIPESRLDEL
jgi:2,3-bisphosphoglycerate-dependent phosphoglycerate mutase